MKQIEYSEKYFIENGEATPTGYGTWNFMISPKPIIPTTYPPRPNYKYSFPVTYFSGFIRFSFTGTRTQAIPQAKKKAEQLNWNYVTLSLFSPIHRTHNPTLTPSVLTGPPKPLKPKKRA